MRVSSSGGDFEEIIKCEEDKETDLHDATCLEDGSVLFAPHAEGGRPNSLWIFADGHRTELLKLAADQDIWFPVYSPAGFILYHRHPANAGVWALPFSLADRKATGDPFLVAANADVPSVSNDGTLVSVRGVGTASRDSIWVDRTGKMLGPIGPFEDAVAVSGAVARWTLTWRSSPRTTSSMTSGSTTPSAGRGRVCRPRRPQYSIEAWSPDGRSIVYSEGATPPVPMKMKNADGSGEAKSLRTGWSPSYSADGRYLLFADFNKDSNWDIWYLDMQSGAARLRS